MVTYGLGNSTRCGKILLRPELLEYLIMGFFYGLPFFHSSFFNFKHLYSVKRFLGNVRAYITLQGLPEDKVFSEWLVPGFGMFITGFTDAEGCFMLSIHKRKRGVLRNPNDCWAMIPQFRIQVHKRDLPLLQKITII
jgi:hypothetical protein